VGCDWRDKARRFRDIWRGLCQAIPWRSERIYLKDEGGRKKNFGFWMVDFAFGKQFRQEDRICRIKQEGGKMVDFRCWILDSFRIFLQARSSDNSASMVSMLGRLEASSAGRARVSS
jgi:hypothetical protein